MIKCKKRSFIRPPPNQSLAGIVNGYPLLSQVSFVEFPPTTLVKNGHSNQVLQVVYAKVIVLPCETKFVSLSIDGSFTVWTIEKGIFVKLFYFPCPDDSQRSGGPIIFSSEGFIAWLQKDALIMKKCSQLEDCSEKKFINGILQQINFPTCIITIIVNYYFK